MYNCLKREPVRLAYALRTHKTQGSEYRTVLIPMTLSHFITLSNKLLYTAVTRAKGKVILVGEDYAFRSACWKKDVTVRDTVLKMLPMPDLAAKGRARGSSCYEKLHKGAPGTISSASSTVLGS